ncbi:MAG: restriction endonuclease subunit S [Acidovorax sp.]|nr:restriction endonuclease subunit S [Acidovorax sp.]
MSGVGKPGYKETAVGWIPVEWKSDTLDALVSIVYGKSPSDIAKLDSGVPIYGTGGISGFTDNSLCDGPSIILGRKGTIDKVQFSEQPFWAIDTTFYTTPKTTFDWHWLYFVLSSFDLRKLNEASGVPSLSRENLAALEVAIPPLPEQQKIAAILTAVDDKLDLIARQISATQTLKQGLMQTLFTRGAGTQDAQGRWHPHTEFQDTELGRIPVGWRVTTLEQVANVERGKFSVRPRNDPRYFEAGDIPFIQTGDIAAATRYVTKSSQFINEAGLTVSRLFPVGTIFITIAANIGDVAMAKLPMACPDSLVGILPSSAECDGMWLYYLLKNSKEYFDSQSTQNAQKNINLQVLRPFAFGLPPLAEQAHIAGSLGSIDDKLEVLTTHQTHYQSLKRGLMQKLLTGQWRVRVDAATLAPLNEKAPA